MVPFKHRSLDLSQGQTKQVSNLVSTSSPPGEITEEMRSTLATCRTPTLSWRLNRRDVDYSYFGHFRGILNLAL